MNLFNYSNHLHFLFYKNIKTTTTIKKFLFVLTDKLIDIDYLL